MLARRLKSLGTEVAELSTQVDRTSEQIRGVWRGHDTDRFVDSWQRTMRPNFKRVADDIIGLAQSAMNNADEQERASGGGSGGGAGSGGGRTGGTSGRTPDSISGLIGEVSSGDVNTNDGLRIQYAIDADGRYKVIVYIGGTDSNNPLLQWRDNIGSSLGYSEMGAHIMSELNRMGLNGENVDILLVGYSQGGLVAEGVARVGDFGSVMIVTEASPPLNKDLGNADMLRLNSPGSVNDLIYLANMGVQGFDRLPDFGPSSVREGEQGLRLSENTGSRLDTYGQGMKMTPNGTSYVDGGAIFNAGVEAHEDHDLYRGAAQEFEGRADAGAQEFKSRISQFQGLDVIYDSDVKSRTSEGLSPNSLPQF